MVMWREVGEGCLPSELYILSHKQQTIRMNLILRTHCIVPDVT